MKLMELLEQGKKATREYFLEEYICVCNETEIIKKNKEKYNPSFKDLTRNDWYEHKEYKTNFEFEEGMDDAYIIDNAEIYPLPCLKQNHYEGYIKNFNAFPNKELAEFIQKKQLLERELMAFSYLNGASEIDWKNNDSKHYVYCYYSNDKVNIEVDCNTSHCEISNVYFKNIETCEKAIELYKEEIKEVMEMKIKLGF